MPSCDVTTGGGLPAGDAPGSSNQSLWDDLAELPTERSWHEVRQRFLEATQETLDPWIEAGQRYVQSHLVFALGRFDEGAGFLRHLERTTQRDATPRDVLDLGTGSGGIAFAFANCTRYRVSSLDVGQNRTLRRMARSTGLRVRYVLATGNDLPYASESFDVVLLVETLEHVSQPHRLGKEIMRVLRPGGVCWITTPPRAKFLFAPDPHYGVRFLAGLPNPVQRFIVNRIARRRIVSPDGQSWPAYDVEHLYWCVRDITRLFPGPKRIDVLFNRPPIEAPPISAGWWYRKFRNFLFGHVLIFKAVGN